MSVVGLSYVCGWTELCLLFGLSYVCGWTELCLWLE